MLVDDKGVLDTSVDIGSALALCDGSTEAKPNDVKKRGRAVQDDDDADCRRRRTSKQAPKKPKAGVKGKAKPGKRKKDDDDDDDDDDEGGEDDSPGEGEKKGDEKKDYVKKGDEKKDYVKKGDEKKGDEKGKTSGPRRDPSKRRKFFSIWDQLPDDVRSHVESLDRGEQTAFINGCVDRSDGKLIVKPSTMYQMMIKKQEKKGGLEKMAGCIFEDPNLRYT